MIQEKKSKKMNSLFLSIPQYLQDPFIASFFLAFFLLLIFFNRNKFGNRRLTSDGVSQSQAMIHSIGTHVPEHIATADYFLKVVSYFINKHCISIMYMYTNFPFSVSYPSPFPSPLLQILFSYYYNSVIHLVMMMKQKSM